MRSESATNTRRDCQPREELISPVKKIRVLTFLLCSFLISNDLSVYFGVHSESVQAMFSNLIAVGNNNNHLFMPQFRITHLGDYYFVSSVRIDGLREDTEEVKAIRSWLATDWGENTLLHNQVIRSVTRRLCNHGGTVRLDLIQMTGAKIHLENACNDPFFASESRWIPIRLHAPYLDYGWLQHTGVVSSKDHLWKW